MRRTLHVGPVYVTDTLLTDATGLADSMMMWRQGNEFCIIGPLFLCEFPDSHTGPFSGEPISPYKGPEIQSCDIIFVFSITGFWTNSQVAGDMKYHDAHVTSLYIMKTWWQNIVRDLSALWNRRCKTRSMSLSYKMCMYKLTDYEFGSG